MAIMPIGKIEQAILLIRGEKVILDADLAAIYGVPTKRLNEQIRRNMYRFPDDFMFQLTKEEAESLRSQIATSKGRGGRRYAPYAFTEHGAIMAAAVLNSQRAVQVSVYVVRAFVQLRRMLAQNKELAAKLAALERKVGDHNQKIVALIQAIRELMAPPLERPRKPIGFQTERQP
jgi:phage regulator Rha-like protein